MLAGLFLLGGVLLYIGYVFYGRVLDRKLGVGKGAKMPSETEYDGVDYVPTKWTILFGHHFSSIAGAGPIVGPVIAALAFGWLPAFVWIVLGSVLIGGVHDYLSLVASLRHRGRSIGEVAREVISPATQRIFVAFIWLMLIYVLVVFLDLTASTFEANGGVATSSILFVALAILFGASIYRLRIPASVGSLIFVPLVFVAIPVGQLIPIDHVPAIAGDEGKTWSLLLVAYCYIASVTPVWVLLQPRDYLSSFLLFATVVVSAAGLLLGGFDIRYTAFAGFSSPLGPLFPVLFITIACGAVSGFHSVIASGTTSKQVAREQDAKKIGYGGMVTEGLVSLIALATVTMLAAGSPEVAAYKSHKMSAIAVFSSGVGRFLGAFGLPERLGSNFAALAVSTFLLTTLDTVTRLGRFLFHEFFGIKRIGLRYFSSAVTLVLPAILVMLRFKDAAGNPVPAWKAIWPVFGASNQLLAGLALLVVAIWLKKAGRSGAYVAIPTVFMFVVTFWGLAYVVVGGKQNSIVEGIAVALFVLALVMIWLGVRSLRRWVSYGGAVHR